MVKSSELKNTPSHIAIAGCKAISEIMLPMLEKHGIISFNYYKIYNNSTAVRLSTHREWTEHYFQKDYIHSSSTPMDVISKPINFFIWRIEDCPEMLSDAAINFNIDNGITVAKVLANSMEYYGFGSTRGNTAIVNKFYVNNLDLLNAFTLIFKEKASNLLKQAEQDKILLPQKAPINYFPIIDKSLSTIALSKQQKSCAKLLLQGKLNKEIANELNLSIRTIEFYIENMRAKLGCRNKSELIIKLLSLQNCNSV